MLLVELLEGLDYKIKGTPGEIGGINYDSRLVQGGDLFVAIKGFQTDGHNFAEEAVQRGAAAVLVERLLPGLAVPQIVVASTRRALGPISATFYGHPGKKLRLLGITGTNGKTTTAFLLKSILEAAGSGVGLIGTVGTFVKDRVLAGTRTTPESLELQQTLAAMVDANLDYAVLEVSSHALALHRTAGLEFSGSIFTNLSQDHLDFHENLQNYGEAKARLFQNTSDFAVLNGDDKWAARLGETSLCPVVTYGIHSSASFQAEKIQLEKEGVSYILSSKVGQIRINLQLTGYFNAYNSLGAAALCSSLGIPLEIIKRGLEAVSGVPGRFEKVANKAGLSVIVDYAHTPDGLKNVLEAAREITAGKVILVFGAGGDRDKGKRPLMGKVAGELADHVIITSDNPRSEEPLKICGEIEAGLKGHSASSYEIISDRREAIKKAIFLAAKNDVVLIAGKGHENYQEFASGRIPFDDREEAKAAIEELSEGCKH